MRRQVTVLGATGSVGRAALDLVGRAGERLQVEALTAYDDVVGLARLAAEHKPKMVGIADERGYKELQEMVGAGVEVVAGAGGITEAASGEAACVVAAVSGAAGLSPLLAAVRRGAQVVLANKEPLVCAGALVMEEAVRCKAQLLPVDSEHNALWQLLCAHGERPLVRATLTASGGPFYQASAQSMAQATPQEACEHPVWKMGQKIAVDSATMMNKGLEIIEASWLFGLESSKLGAVVHPQGVVHALASYEDGAVFAHCAKADMRLPLAHALYWPDSPPPSHALAEEDLGLSIEDLGSLEFFPVDEKKFPAPRLAVSALQEGGAYPAWLNAANEVAVGAFLAGRIGFLDIVSVVERSMASGVEGEVATLEGVLGADAAARACAHTWLGRMA